MSNLPNSDGNLSYGRERVPPNALPMMEPTVHVKPYRAKASVEFVSSVISAKAARTTATFPHSAPDRHRVNIIIQKLVDRPLVISKSMAGSDRLTKAIQRSQHRQDQSVSLVSDRCD